MQAGLRCLLTRASAAAFLAAGASAAHAHTTVREVGDFYAGVLHPLTTLEHVLPFAALGLLIGQQGRKASSAVVVFSGMLMLGATSALWIPAVPYLALLNICSVVLFGALIAAARPLPVAITQGIAIVFGFSTTASQTAARSPAQSDLIYSYRESGWRGSSCPPGE